MAIAIITWETLAFAAQTRMYTYLCDASDLGLCAGQWPQALLCDANLGNGQPFVRGEPVRDADGELLEVAYHQSCGVFTLRLRND